MSKQPIFNLIIDDISKEELVTEILSLRGFNFVVTPNLQHLVVIDQSKAVKSCYSKAKYTICDSQVFQLLSKLVKKKLDNVIPGSDLTKFYFDSVLTEDDSIMVIGSSVENIEKLSQLHPDLFFEHFNPPMGFINVEEEVEKVILAITNHRPRYLFLAVGFPRQEMLACQLKSRINFDCTAFCIGASIDFLTGNQKRAPIIFQTLKMEWLYRFIQEPKRLFKRYFVESWGIIPLIFKELMVK